jgi:hypothetical protein
MKSYRETILPGVGLSQRLGGRMFYIQRCSAGPVLTVDLYRGGDVQTVENVGKGFKAEPVGGFDAFRVRTAVESVVDFVIADGNVQVQFDEETTIGNMDGQAIPIRTPVGAPLEVLFGGTVSPVLGVVTIDNNDLEAIPFKVVQALSVVNVAPSAVTDVPVQILAASPTRKGARFRNVGEEPVALGGADVNFDDAVVIVQPGETWNENEAAPAAWSAVCGTGLVSNINIQTIA